MLERERRVGEFVLASIEKLMADVSDEDLSNQPLPGMNPPRWILGHLAVVTDSAQRLFDKSPHLPEQWQATFGPGSKHEVAGAPNPSRSELLTALRSGYERLFAELDRQLDQAGLILRRGTMLDATVIETAAARPPTCPSPSFPSSSTTPTPTWCSAAARRARPQPGSPR